MAQNDVNVAMSEGYFTSLSYLPSKIKTQANKLVTKLKNNPSASGINLEKVESALSGNIYSARINDNYRAILFRQEEKEIFVILWVDTHDKAYEWARRRQININKITNIIQIYEVEDSSNQNREISGMFSKFDANRLIMMGIPKEMMSLIMSIQNIGELYKAKASLPKDSYEILECLADGDSIDEVERAYLKEPSNETANYDFAEALKGDKNKSSFYVPESEEELMRILSEPLEKWRIFLHPTQQMLAKKNFSGPSRLLGGAGTGKTVVAMHRAKFLASGLEGNDKVLFTTFTANLADDIKDNLRKICSDEELKRIEVIHLDAWVSHFLRENGYTYRIEYDEAISSIWNEVINQSGENINFSQDFIIDEWANIAVSQDCFTREDYLKASRVGRGTRLDRKQRNEVWGAFEKYISLMKERQIRDIDTAMRECRLILQQSQSGAMYSSIIVDEGQDFSPNAFKLIRAIAGETHRNDIFIVGDSHQRIYNKKAVLSQCGINIVGRGGYLRINYRTTEEIRKYAFAVLNGIQFDNLDNEYEGYERCYSLTHGDYPHIRSFRDASEEYAYIVNEIKRLTEIGIDQKDICLVARTHDLIKTYARVLLNAGIRAYEIKKSKLDDRGFEGVRLATMHRVKGLEFQYMFIAAANDRIIPFAKAINRDTDEASRQESIISEKCLLYVALTRAQKEAYVTSYGAKSELLP